MGIYEVFNQKVLPELFKESCKGKKQANLRTGK